MSLIPNFKLESCKLCRGSDTCQFIQQLFMFGSWSTPTLTVLAVGSVALLIGIGWLTSEQTEPQPPTKKKTVSVKKKVTQKKKSFSAPHQLHELQKQLSNIEISVTNLCSIQELPNEQTVKSSNKQLLELGEKLMQIQLKIDAIQVEADYQLIVMYD